MVLIRIFKFLGKLFGIKFLLKRLQLKLAYASNKEGIKFLFKVQDFVNSYVLGAVKIAEGGINPKHMIEGFDEFFLDSITETDRVLDVGCGYGHLAYILASKAESVEALDIRSEAVEWAKKRFQRPNLVFKTSDFFDFHTIKKFDVVIISNILEHIDERKEFLKKTASIGKRILNRVPAFDRHWMVQYRKDLGVEWRLHKDHKLEYTETLLRSEVEEADLQVDRICAGWGNICCMARVISNT
jgi:SAM-dependent methyltransferase